jgi:hypothetical protein
VYHSSRLIPRTQAIVVLVVLRFFIHGFMPLLEEVVPRTGFSSR